MRIALDRSRRYTMGLFESSNFRLLVQLVPSESGCYIHWYATIYKMEFSRYEQVKNCSRPKHAKAFAFTQVLTYLRDNHSWESASMVSLLGEMQAFFEACRKEGIEPKQFGL